MVEAGRFIIACDCVPEFEITFKLKTAVISLTEEVGRYCTQSSNWGLHTLTYPSRGTPGGPLQLGRLGGEGKEKGYAKWLCVSISSSLSMTL